MSIGSIGATGLPDDQAVENWDSDSFAWQISGTFAARQDSPALHVTRYGYVYCQGGVTAGTCAFKFQWYTDATLTLQCGYFCLILDQGIPQSCQLILPHIGRYFVASMVPLAGVASYTCTANILLNNRNAAPSGAQAGGVLGSFLGNINAGATQTLYLQKYYGGPSQWSVFGGSQGINVTLNYRQESTNVWTPFYAYSVAAGVTDNRNILLPNDALQYTLQNQSGALANNTATLSIVGSFTGSS